MATRRTAPTLSLARAWLFACGLLGAVWAAFVVQAILHIAPGVLPRTEVGLYCLPFSFLFHVNLGHIMANSGPLFILSGLFAMRCHSLGEAILVSLVMETAASSIVWVVGDNAVHLGASQLLFAYFGYLLGGLWAPERSLWQQLYRTALAGVALLLYWQLIPALFAFQPGVSWSGHAAGALVGFACGRWRR